MQKTLVIKLSIIAGLCLIFTIGLGIFRSVIYERQSYADSVIKEIAEQHVDPQEVITPFVVIPTTIIPNCSTNELVEKNECRPPYTQLNTFLADQTTANENLKVSTDTYVRSIYHATSYEGELNFDQSYRFDSIQTPDLTSVIAPSKDNADKINTHWNQARLIIPVSDLRGVPSLPTVTISGEKIKATYPKTQIIKGLNYIEAPLPPSLITRLKKLSQTTATAASIQEADVVNADSTISQATPRSNSEKPASIQLESIKIVTHLPLSGISNLSTVPTGHNFELAMTSNWHSPNFIGSALPNTKTLSANGFNAKWQNQYITVANNQNLEQCLNVANSRCNLISSASLDFNTYSSHGDEIYEAVDGEPTHLDSVRLSGFGVSFAEPNDVYLQTERTMKYALLLVLVSFGTFFLFEVIKSSRIHPIQYLLVGSALLVFYVLLLPLAEQIVFWKAYTIAATACVGLIGWYSYYVLGNIKRAITFTAILSGLYAAFYGILTTEDLNLLLGAVFCFVLLASVMVMTRKIDWYQVT